jgi:hypothetical protein
MRATSMRLERLLQRAADFSRCTRNRPLNNRSRIAKLRSHPAPDEPIPGEVAMRISKSLMLSAFVILIGSNTAFAQLAAAKPSDTEKKAISKTCSDLATAKGLHGKERKAFRSECKKNGGKPA